MMNFIFFFLINLVCYSGFSQKSKTPEPVKFIDKIVIPCSSVKNQFHSGTCWSFATVSFIEAELLRIKQVDYDLSEMFFVNYAYKQKAVDYVSYQGKTNFSEGGQAHDVMNIIKEYGVVPETVYNGLNYGETHHNHDEFSGMLTNMLSGLIGEAGSKLTTAWKPSVNSVIDIYLGEIPENFTYKDKNYTPYSFAKELNINPDDYYEFSSYTNEPFYEWFILKIPDNWSRGEYMNLPIDELVSLIDNALLNGFSVCWDGDVSENGFSHKHEMAVIPEKPVQFLSPAEKDEYFSTLKDEAIITQEMRQSAFENLTTTDDHLMHIIGISYDQKGKKYYKTKNSWGTTSNSIGGYLYMSESYIKLKTTAIMIHKDAIIPEMKNKIKL
ncbi:MAG: C1 family peptidase [Bacteroidota bacterium]